VLPKNVLNRIIINKNLTMAKYSKKEAQETTEPAIVAEKQPGLTPIEKKLLKESMRRHDKALRMLANM